MPLWKPYVLLLSLALATASCGPGYSPGSRQRLDAGSLQEQARSLEQRRARAPRDVDTRIALGEVYYLIARDALDRQRDEGRYLAYLERSVEEFVTALELEPRAEDPHFYLAVMDAYRGDLLSALRGFNNVKRLNPSPIAYTNIAEIYVYRGQPERARKWNDLAVRKGAPPGPVTFNEMLIAWKENDLMEARRRFNQLARNDPEMIRTINVARLPRQPESFEDFAGYCCASPACGPYMQRECAALSLDVEERAMSEEALLQELRLEMEAKRRLRKVYEQRKELEIDIEAPPGE